MRVWEWKGKSGMMGRMIEMGVMRKKIVEDRGGKINGGEKEGKVGNIK